MKRRNIKTNQIIITAAASNCSQELPLVEDKKNAAAVFSDNKKTGQENTLPRIPTSQPISYLSPKDAVIGSALTPNQQLRVDTAARTLNPAHSKTLAEEISYCLLNPKHFTACSLDFSRKLNAIRKVILLGEWQTPANMVIKDEQKKDLCSSNA